MQSEVRGEPVGIDFVRFFPSAAVDDGFGVGFQPFHGGVGAGGGVPGSGMDEGGGGLEGHCWGGGGEDDVRGGSVLVGWVGEWLLR